MTSDEDSSGIMDFVGGELNVLVEPRLNRNDQVTDIFQLIEN